MIKNFIYNSVYLMPALLFPALGGLFTSLCKTLNIALEGLILISAFFTASIYVLTNNLAIAIVSSIIITSLVAYIQSVFVIYLKANNFIVGLSINMLALGITSLMSYKLFGHNGVIVANNISLAKPFSSLLPEFLNHNIFVYLSIALIFIIYFLVNKTIFGLKLRSIGLDKVSAITGGVNTNKYIIISFVISGVFTSLSGIYLFLSLSSYSPNMSASKGWIALVLIFLGRQNVFFIFISAFIFAFSDTLSNYAQGVLNIPTDFIFAIPFVVCLVFLILQSLDFKSKIIKS